MNNTTSSQLISRVRTLLASSNKTSTWTSTLGGVIVALALLSALKSGRLNSAKPNRPDDADSTDPGILSKHSIIGPVTTRRFTYPSIRIVFHAHPKLTKLQSDIPLLVFVHGLGGSAAQFAPLVTSLCNIASCLLLDLPGCGRSDLRPTDEAAYTLPAFAEIVAAAIERYREPHQRVVIIGHSLGCSVGALLASSTSPLKHILAKEGTVAGFIAVCPRADPVSSAQQKQLRRLKYVPATLFDVFRAWDRRGGLDSKSITRFVGEEADDETKRLQVRFNAQSRSATVLKFLAALGRDDAGWPDEAIWKGLEVPVFLVAAEGDKVLTPRYVDQIVALLTKGHNGKPTVTREQDSIGKPPGIASQEPSKRSENSTSATNSVPTATGDVDLTTNLLTSSDQSDSKPIIVAHDDSAITTFETEHKTAHRAHIIKTTLFPAPAAHGVIYATSTVRPLASLIQGFLSTYIDKRLSAAWQLNHMSTAGKWEVKNLRKWETVAPISGVIANMFRALKTMREVDDVHNPKEFVKVHGCWDPEGKFRSDGVGIVVDISHEIPVYDPQGLKAGRVQYHKFPTVSKLPPSPDEVAAFIALIDRLKADDENIKDGAMIGVHCHYGFNRTGFFIVSYLIEQMGWSVQGALDEFKAQRMPGIKHGYFIDELFLRYGVKIERRGTIIG